MRNTRRRNREKALADWKRKWGLDDYYFFIRRDVFKVSEVMVVHEKMRHYFLNNVTEMTGLQSILTRLRWPRVRIRLYDPGENYGVLFETLDGFKHHCLLIKLSGIGFK